MKKYSKARPHSVEGVFLVRHLQKDDGIKTAYYSVESTWQGGTFPEKQFRADQKDEAILEVYKQLNGLYRAAKKRSKLFKEKLGKDSK